MLDSGARADVLAAVEALAAGEVDGPLGTLYDDYEVLPDPARSVGVYLVEPDVAPLHALAVTLGPLVGRHGLDDGAPYAADPAWPAVVAAARAAVAAMAAAPAPERPHVPLALGSVLGWSPSSRRWEDAVRALTGRVAAAREGVRSPVEVLVVYLVPGSGVEPGFEGVEVDQVSARRRSVTVRVALPLEAPADPAGFVHARLAEAVAAAELRVAARRLAPALPEVAGIVAAVAPR